MLDQSEVRLAELVATLSLGTDLGLGQPMEHVLRQTLIALNLGDRLGFDDSERRVLYYSGLLAWVGCHIDAYEQAMWFGDDIALKADSYTAEFLPGYLLSHLGVGRPLLDRARLGAAFAVGGWRTLANMLENHWLATDALAERLGLGKDVRDSLEQGFERWDGKHTPRGIKGEEILPTSRVIHLANVVEVFHNIGGVEAALSVARRRSGSQFDPDVVDLFCGCAVELFAGLNASATWDAVIASEPTLTVRLSDGEFEDALAAIADFSDMKSPFTIGHSASVAGLAAEAARAYGLDDAEVRAIKRAALVHDIGRLGVSNSIWDKPGSLTKAEVERIRLHPYLTERMLAFSPSLARLGEIAVQNHERMDGSGYPKGISGPAISVPGRILAAADVYHAMTERRPYRAARQPEEAAAELRAEVSAGRLDGKATDAVLRASGHRVAVRPDRPGGLTPREVEVLKLVALGMSNKQIAKQLVISPKTAGNHIEHIYTRIGATNRATASLFAMKHGLLTDAYSLDWDPGIGGHQHSPATFRS